MARFLKICIINGFVLSWILKSGLYAHSEVAGIQSGVWSLEKSPYVVKGDVIIPKGLVLKIEEGVVIKFAGNYQLSVKGGLIARGNRANPVIFTSIFDNEFGKITIKQTKIPHPSSWEGIEFLDDCDDYLTVLNHCIIRYSKWGIRCMNSHPLLTNLMFVDNDSSSLKINDQKHKIANGQRVNLISHDTRPLIDPLPEPIQETDLQKAIRLMQEQQQKIEQQRLKAVQDSIRKAQKIKPILTKTGTLVLKRQLIEQLNIQSVNDLISYLPGFLNIATIWKGTQITSRGVPPTLSTNRLLFQINSVPFYEPISRTSYLELIPNDAIERIEISRGISISQFNHHGIAGSANFISRYGEPGIVNKSKFELGNFGTKKLTAFLGLNQDPTFLNLYCNFMNSNGYWRTFSQDELGVSFQQKYSYDLYNFSGFLKHRSVSIFTSYFEQDQYQLGLVPQKQYMGPTNRRGFVFSLSKDFIINPQLSTRFIGSYVKNYEKSEVGSLGSDSIEKTPTDNYSLSNGKLWNVSILSQYKKVHYLAKSGITVSRLTVAPLFDIKNQSVSSGQTEDGNSSLKMTEYECSGFVEIGYNISPFIGFQGKTHVNFMNMFNRPDLSVDAKISYNPFLPFDSYLRYTQTVRLATQIERRIYLPGFFYGNDQLKPEKFEQWEWCTDIHPMQDWTWGIVVYHLKYNDLIKANPDYQFINNKQVFWTNGSEFSIEGKFKNRFFLLANITYNDIKYSTWLYPKLKVNGLMAIYWHRIFSTITMFQYLSQSKSLLNMGPYYLLHLTLTYQFLPKIRFSLSGYDLLDQRPENPEYIRGVIPAIPAGSGRSVLLTMTIE